MKVIQLQVPNLFKKGLILYETSSCPTTCTSQISSAHALYRRRMHTQHITQNMAYISNDKLSLKLDPETMKLNQEIKKPLCIIMNWMMAKDKHVQKYAALYLPRGFDALAVSCTPWQLMWPTTGSQVITDKLLRFMEKNCHTPMVVHGFSVGAYVWAELLVHAVKNKSRFQPVLDRVAAQAWDSPTDVDELAVGMPVAVFPNSKILQAIFKAYISAHLKVFHNTATRHYKRATEVFHATPCRAPTLFLVSETDPIGAVKRSLHAKDCMQKMGMKCNMKCWKSSPHVRHYNHHPEEYREVLDKHLKECGLTS